MDQVVARAEPKMAGKPVGRGGRRIPVALFKGDPYALLALKETPSYSAGLPLRLVRWDGKRWILTSDQIVLPNCGNATDNELIGGTSRLYAVQSSPQERPGLLVRSFDGQTWSDLPSPAASKEAFCTWPAVEVHGDDLYLAYLERAMPGRQVNRLLVKRWDGRAWQALGGPLNVFGPDTDDWAFSPGLALKVEGGEQAKVTPYVAFCEHVWGNPPQVFVKHWDGSAWASDVAEGCSLNMDPAAGSAQSARIAIHNGRPIVAWAEHVYGGGRMRKVYVKQLLK